MPAFLLQPCELLAITHRVGAKAILGMSQDELFPPDLGRELDRGASLLGGRGLVALSGTAPRMDAALQDLAETMVRPELAFAMTREVPGEALQVYVGFLRAGCAVLHAKLPDGRHHLDALANEGEIVSALIDAMAMPDSPRQIALSIPFDHLEAAAVLACDGDPAAASARLVWAGLQPRDAQQLAETFALPRSRNAVAAFRVVGIEITAEHQLTVWHGRDSLWQMQAMPDEDLISIEHTNPRHVKTTLQGFLADLHGKRWV